MTQEQQIALYEEARSLANIACWSIELQIHRLRKKEAEIPEFVMQPVADFHFLIMLSTDFAAPQTWRLKPSTYRFK